jgi:hypothetical protein
MQQNGWQLIGWVRKQTEGCKSWIIGNGKKPGVKGRVVDRTANQVGQAFFTC